MDYELAKELKAAGFPQGDRHWYFRVSTEPVTLWCVNALEKFEWGDHPDFVAAPTLEELIEACGEGFQFNLLETSIGLFQASCWVDGRGEERISRSGSTPPKAVARMYIALHTK